MPAIDLDTTAGSGDDNGYVQWSMFITEWMGRPTERDAARISSAADASGVVGHSIASNPLSLASLKRSATLRFFGNMLYSTAFWIGRRWAEEGRAAERRVREELRNDRRFIVPPYYSLEGDFGLIYARTNSYRSSVAAAVTSFS